MTNDKIQSQNVDKEYWAMQIHTETLPHGVYSLVYKARERDSKRIGQNLLITLSDVVQSMGMEKRSQLTPMDVPRRVTEEEYQNMVLSQHTTEEEWDRSIQNKYNHWRFE